MKDWVDRAAECQAKQIPFVLVTLVDAAGSSPQVPGAKAIVTREGLYAGTVGGGRIELKAIAHAQGLLRQDGQRPCEFVRWNLIRDVGMTCGGIVSLFFEVFNGSPWKIVVFGAGHVGQEVVTVLARLDCHITCIDHRPEWLQRLPELANLTKIHSSEPKNELAALPDDAFYLLMTPGHRTDLPVLHELLTTKSPPFVGVIGSNSKAAVIRKDLRELGVSEEKIASFYCPVGMPFGDSTPPEIAISIAAQLIDQREILRPGLSHPRVSGKRRQRSLNQDKPPVLPHCST